MNGANCTADSVNGDGDCLSWERPDLPPKCKWDVNNFASQTSPHTVCRPVRNRKSICSSILETTGDTPMVRLSRLEKEYGLKCQLLGKCEFFNPGGSIKDRIALRMMEDAEKEGRIKPGYTIIEPTAGNTGIGLALACAVKGYRCIMVMPERMSMEKVNVMKALGAEIVRTTTGERYYLPDSQIRVAQKLEREIPNAVILAQYRNPGNPLAHYDTTAEEILEQCEGHVDMIVCGAGTGGTVTGIGRKFREKCPGCKVIAVDPEGSEMALPIELNKAGLKPYEVEGIGLDFVSSVQDRSIIDKWYKSNDKDSLVMARKLIRSEGLLCGGSSGAAASIAVEAAKELKEGQKCVVIFPDSVRNDMSKHLMEEWMIERGFLPDKSENIQWWSKRKVGEMKHLPPIPVTILPSTTCKEASDYMESQGFDQMPIVDSDGKMIGVVTMGSLASNLSAGKVTSSDPVTKCLYSKLKKIKTNDNLTMLRRLLETNRFVIVTGPRLQYDQIQPGSSAKKLQKSEVRSDGEGVNNITGIVTAVDFLHFISKQQ